MEQASPNPGVAGDRHRSLPPALRLDTVRISVEGHVRAAPISLQVAPLEMVALVGPAGPLASQLLRCISGLATPGAGRIEIAGEPPRLGHDAVGISFSDPMLLEWRTALGNVLVQAEVRGLSIAAAAERARRLLAAAGLAGRENEKPAGLSKAEAQRVSMCRALLHEPALLLLEDPFLGLDALEREQLCHDFERLVREAPAAVFLATPQILEAALLTDRVLVFAGEPRSIQEVVQIELPRPRRWDSLQTARLTEIAGRVRTLLHAHGALA